MNNKETDLDCDYDYDFTVKVPFKSRRYKMKVINEVAVCEHPKSQRKYYNDAPQFFCFACCSYVQTDL